MIAVKMVFVKFWGQRANLGMAMCLIFSGVKILSITGCEHWSHVPCRCAVSCVVWSLHCKWGGLLVLRIQYWSKVPMSSSREEAVLTMVLYVLKVVALWQCFSVYYGCRYCWQQLKQLVSRSYSLIKKFSLFMIYFIYDKLYLSFFCVIIVTIS